MSTFGNCGSVFFVHIEVFADFLVMGIIFGENSLLCKISKSDNLLNFPVKKRNFVRQIFVFVKKNTDINTLNQL